MTAWSFVLPGFLLQLVGKFHDQDAVLRHEADERDEANLAVNVDASSCPGTAEEERARQRKRDGPEEHDQRIAEALELRREKRKMSTMESSSVVLSLLPSTRSCRASPA